MSSGDALRASVQHYPDLHHTCERQAVKRKVVNAATFRFSTNNDAFLSEAVSREDVKHRPTESSSQSLWPLHKSVY